MSITWRILDWLRSYTRGRVGLLTILSNWDKFLYAFRKVKERAFELGIQKFPTENSGFFSLANHFMKYLLQVVEK